MIRIFLTIEDVILKSSSFEQIIEVLDMNSTDEWKWINYSTIPIIS